LDKKPISQKWIKASVLGTTWASSEIILGSFLHNLRVPFSGSILTGIGLILLISASYRWKEKGLFWRSGLICAVLKTMSPSAIIFGPMIAIFMEALFFEFSVRIIGKNFMGFAFASVLAMSWGLIQKLVNYIIFYGFEIVKLYEGFMEYAQKQLQWDIDLVWTPILFVLAVNVALGIIAAWLGMKTGRKLLKACTIKSFKHYNHNYKKSSAEDVFPYSVSWLVVNVLMLFFPFLIYFLFPFWVWVSTVIAIVLAWAIRYRRVLRQLSRPKLWIFFVVITMISAFVFSKIQQQENSLMEGGRIGLEMNFRAMLLIMGFTVLGTELYNPKVRKAFGHSRYRQLTAAVELSVSILPQTIKNLPGVKQLLKQPGSVILSVIVQSESLLESLLIKYSLPRAVIIVNGDVSEGKTSLLKKISDLFINKEQKICGILSPRIMEGKKTIAYQIVTLSNKKSYVFLRKDENAEKHDIGKFLIQKESYIAGLKEMEKTTGENTVLFVDEVGRLEINEKGWFPALQKALSTPNIVVIIAVRTKFLSMVMDKWPDQNFIIYNVSTDPAAIANRVDSLLG